MTCNRPAMLGHEGTFLPTKESARRLLRANSQVANLQSSQTFPRLAGWNRESAHPRSTRIPQGKWFCCKYTVRNRDTASCLDRDPVFTCLPAILLREATPHERYWQHIPSWTC